MSGSSFLVLDTNVVLYHLGGRLQKPLEKKQYVISIITEIELLSYPPIQAYEINLIQNFINDVTVVELKNPIKTETISLRKKYNLKVPDAIIAATAFKLGAPLLTNDKKLLSIAEIETYPVGLISS
ncbi:putative nucleic acid-binding protein [Xenococcus sp. PCC 7305]|uniref:type II toxin-antitoxin system VapC family toxin n=1 Tax=Xenococcus sp. PCC 7305 TaxID=102125 RepID=UPI0002ABCE65|nr:type II toxin-antitoxin system VapC family toxin [Xenococcus sp. PCC 7305]ELS02734.1 putative nucleic acid-binding protein [Xenococcus sp. PCC 7305]